MLTTLLLTLACSSSGDDTGNALGLGKAVPVPDEGLSDASWFEVGNELFFTQMFGAYDASDVSLVIGEGEVVTGSSIWVEHSHLGGAPLDITEVRTIADSELRASLDDDDYAAARQLMEDADATVHAVLAVGEGAGVDLAVWSVAFTFEGGRAPGFAVIDSQVIDGGWSATAAETDCQRAGLDPNQPLPPSECRLPAALEEWTAAQKTCWDTYVTETCKSMTEFDQDAARAWTRRGEARARAMEGLPSNTSLVVFGGTNALAGASLARAIVTASPAGAAITGAGILLRLASSPFEIAAVGREIDAINQEYCQDIEEARKDNSERSKGISERFLTCMSRP